MGNAVRRRSHRSAYQRRYEASIRDVYCLVLKLRGQYDPTLNFRQLRSKNHLSKMETRLVGLLARELLNRTDDHLVSSTTEGIRRLLFPDEEIFTPEALFIAYQNLDWKASVGAITNAAWNEAVCCFQKEREELGESIDLDDLNDRKAVEVMAISNMKRDYPTAYQYFIPIDLTAIPRGEKARVTLDMVRKFIA